jgi:transcriptional regulator
MHPDPKFRADDEALLSRLLGEVGFGTVFAQTADGPRVAHTPVAMGPDGGIRFHLAKRNLLTPQLDGAQALIVIDGPQGYISPRWYAKRDTVPTWNYVSIELEGRVSVLDEAGLEEMLHELIVRHEGKLSGERWSAAETSERVWAAQLEGIVGYELTVTASRSTVKLSQKSSAEERERIAAGLVSASNPALADWMREAAA